MSILKFHSLLILLVNFLLLSSCKVYYKTSDVDAKLKASVTNVNTNCNDILVKLTTLLGAYGALQCPSDVDPFKTATRLSIDVATGQEQIVGMQKTVNDAYASFTSYTKGKEKIASGTEEWKKFKSTRKLVKSTIKTLQKKGEATIEKANEFNSYVKAEIVPVVKVCETKSYMNDFEKKLLEFPNIRQDLSAQIKKYGIQLAAFEKRSGSSHPNELQQLKEDLKILREELPILDGIYSDLEKALADFKTATVNKANIYSCAEEYAVVKNCDSIILQAQKELNDIQASIQRTVAHMQSIIDSIK